MKALLYTKPFELESVDFPKPEIKENEVLIQVKACGICGSDVHGYTGTTGRRIPPVIMGHEASGVIIEKGLKVDKWQLGDHVTFDSTISCGSCYFCERNQINLCSNRKVLGVSCDEYKQDGAMAEYVAVPQNILYALPEGLAFEKAALVEPLSVAVHAINQTPVKNGDTCVVIGAGMIGMMVIQSLQHFGHKNIISVDMDEERLDLALKLGAVAAFNPAKQNVSEEIFKLTDGLGTDVVFDAVGINATFNMGIDCLKKGGAACLIGNYAPKVEMPLQAIVTREISIYGTYISSGEYPKCLEMIVGGAIDVDTLISAVVPLSDGAEWFKRLHDKEPGLIKVILTP
ncbi:MAG TPA: galactitol-1-phosphate 5-dehydrogenase [Draconibacterium sp.]|nr:galactitol-1-phosphate 5-dehydrogenase [Draconibacterium sp.]